MCLLAHTVSPLRTLLQKFHRLDGYRDLFLTVLENWQIQDQGAKRVRVWWGPTSWFGDGLLVTASSLAKEARSSLGSLSLKKKKKSLFFFTFFFGFFGSSLQHMGIFVVSRGLFWCRPCRLSSCGTQTQLPQGMWDLSSLARDRTCVPCTARQILSHWTTKQVIPWGGALRT